jgi:drug/metabolite transporter (DMT)-like permease
VGGNQDTAPTGPADSRPSIFQARLCIIAAAVLWSSGGGFAKLLREETPLGLNNPLLDPLQMASLRVLCAGLILVPLLRPRDFSFQPMLVVTAICFAVMNWTFMTAMSLGSAANAVLLQYTAPMWMYLVAVLFLGEKADWRAGVSVIIGVAGIGVIAFGGWQGEQFRIILYALASGVALAGVWIGLRLLHNASSLLVTTVNLLFSGLVLLPMIWGKPAPTPVQIAVLFVYGGVQMALPYWLMTRGLRTVGPQEAGTLTLIEPLLAPVWAYLVSPGTETPSVYTWIGGGCILGALAYRYWPRGNSLADEASTVAGASG